MFLIKEKPHNVVEKPTHRAGNKMWENWMEKEMEIFPNFILEKKQKSTIFEFIINPKNGQPILEHDNNMTNNIIDNFDYIKSTRNSLQKFRAFDKKTSSYGIILEEFNENGNGWKVAFSYDKFAEIIIIESNQIQILNIIDNEEFVKRLSRDINSKDEKTREISSEVLCYFIEFFGNLINYEFLEHVVLQMLQRLKIENNYDVQQKLIEGIIEYIWFENIEEEHRQNIISDLAKLDNELLFPYFEDEDYKKYEDVNIYLSKRISK